MQFGIGHPPPTHQLQSTCMGEGSRVPNLQTKFNYLDSFKSYGIFSDFVVPTWSPSSPLHPRHPHVIPASSPSSLSSPRHPCCPQKVPMWSPWSVVSTCRPRHPRRPHVVPASSPSSPRHPCRLHIISTSSPSSPEGPHVVSMVCGLHMLSLSSPRHPCHPHII